MNNRFSEKDTLRVKQNWTDWWAGTIDHPFYGIEAVDDSAIHLLEEYSQVTCVESDDISAEKILDEVEQIGKNLQWFGGAFPKFWPNYGPGLIAAFLGSNLNIRRDTVWFDPLPLDELNEIQPEYDPNNIWWQRVQKLTAMAANRWKENVMVAVTDIGGNLDILSHLRGNERLLLDLSDSPEEVIRLTEEITRLWIKYYDRLFNLANGKVFGSSNWSPLWAPGKLYMLQSDFSYMISPRMFKRFVMPDLTACCDFLEYPFYHLDGVGQLNHLPQLLEMPKLRGIQWIPGAGQPNAEEWLDVLKKIRDARKLCQIYVSREGMLKIISKLGWEGFYFSIWEENLIITASLAKEFEKEFLNE
jgi:5-methyltetrahydrofolate--homocysteine methyltransferase